jgi:MFS family permease
MEQERATLTPAHADTETQLPSSQASTMTHEKFTPFSLFSPMKRRFIFIVVCLAGVVSPLSSLLYTPALPTIATGLGVTISQVNLTITTYLIFQGITPALWGTMGDIYGRRLLYIITSSISVGACIGLAITNEYAAVLVLRGLQAAGTSSTRALGAGVIRDLWPQSERGGYMGMYSAGIGIGTAFGPVLGGILAQYTTWHGIFYFLLALSSFCLLATVLFLPETLHSVIKTGVDPLPWHSRPPIPFLTPTSAPHAIYHAEPRPKVNILGPLLLLTHWDVGCIVVFTGVYYTVWQNSMVATSTVYADRYHLNQAEIGLAYISNGIGSLVGSVLVGKVLDYDYAKLLAKENKGIPFPKVTVSKIEHARLKSLAYSAPIFIASIVAFGWVVQAHVSIAASIVMAFFIGWFDAHILTVYCERSFESPVNHR